MMADRLPGVRLELEKVVKVHEGGGRKVTAVDGIDLVVAPGEFFILLGPSGCGKSTLLELLAGLEAPTSGEIRFGGEVAAAPARGLFRTPKERNVAMVFQSYALYPHLTVGGNIAFPLKVGGLKSESVAEAVREAAEAVQIADLLERKPSELSGGQRQRVAIARAIVRKPSLFLMDEPLSNLDARLRASTRGRIKALQRELGVTTVYVTHDQQEAMALGDRVAVLNRGRIEQIGAPADLVARPASAFVARFAGNPPMNLLRMRRSEGGDGIRFSGPGLEWVLAESAMDAEGVDAGGAAAGGKVSSNVGGTPSRSAVRETLPRPGETALLGIRPEDIILREADGDRDRDRDGGAAAGMKKSLAARVDSVEPLGREALVHLTAGPLSFSALSAAGVARAGDAVRAEFDPARVRVFPDDGEPD